MIIDAYNYKQWADQRTLDAVRTIDPDRFPSETAFVRQQLNHMVIVEEVFRARLLGLREPHSASNTDVLPDFAELCHRLANSNAWFAQYVANLDPEQRSEPVSFLFVDGQRGSMTRQEILFHIINHGAYHRGAIGHALDLAHTPRPADTYTVFIHSAQPRRREG
jgi:uncharacterized damage-inducible protein DinB